MATLNKTNLLKEDIKREIHNIKKLLSYFITTIELLNETLNNLEDNLNELAKHIENKDEG